jgi:hypothetical protein
MLRSNWFVRPNAWNGSSLRISAKCFMFVSEDHRNGKKVRSDLMEAKQELLAPHTMLIASALLLTSEGACQKVNLTPN